MKNLIIAYTISFWVMLSAFLFLSLNFHKYFWLLLGISQVCLRISTEEKQPKSLIT